MLSGQACHSGSAITTQHSSGVEGVPLRAKDFPPHTLLRLSVAVAFTDLCARGSRMLVCSIDRPVQCKSLHCGGQRQKHLAVTTVFGCRPNLASWQGNIFVTACTCQLTHARRPVPLCVRTTGGLLGCSTCVGQGPC